MAFSSFANDTYLPIYYDTHLNHPTDIYSGSVDFQTVLCGKMMEQNGCVVGENVPRLRSFNKTLIN